jgi:hypothetical protein
LGKHELEDVLGEVRLLGRVRQGRQSASLDDIERGIDQVWQERPWRMRVRVERANKAFAINLYDVGIVRMVVGMKKDLSRRRLAVGGRPTIEPDRRREPCPRTSR